VGDAGKRQQEGGNPVTIECSESHGSGG
jgi:hypothetical protein